MTTNNKKNQDLSIEEILNSIRGIIGSEGNPSKGEECDGVLELVNVADTDSKKEPHVNNDKSWISEKTASETANVLKSFVKQATTAVKGNKKRQPTVEEFIVEIIRPELSCWLDKNLPTLVHKIVEQEIKRLIPYDDDE